MRSSVGIPSLCESFSLTHACTPFAFKTILNAGMPSPGLLRNASLVSKMRISVVSAMMSSRWRKVTTDRYPCSDSAMGLLYTHAAIVSGPLETVSHETISRVVNCRCPAIGPNPGTMSQINPSRSPRTVHAHTCPTEGAIPILIIPRWPKYK